MDKIKLHSIQLNYMPCPSDVEFACSPRVHKGFPPLKTQQKKHAKEQNTLRRSLTKTDGSSHLVPGRLKKKLPTAPGGSLRKDGPGWEKAEKTFTTTSGLPACVCVSWVASIYARVCSSVSCVPLKT